MPSNSPFDLSIQLFALIQSFAIFLKPQNRRLLSKFGTVRIFATCRYFGTCRSDDKQCESGDQTGNYTALPNLCVCVARGLIITIISNQYVDIWSLTARRPRCLIHLHVLIYRLNLCPVPFGISMATDIIDLNYFRHTVT